MGGDDVLRTAVEADDTQGPGECEVTLLAAIGLRDIGMNVQPDGFETEHRSWSLGKSESFDEGSVCGVEADRTTSVTEFDDAFARLDGAGFGGLIFSQVGYNAVRGEVKTDIQSSLVYAQVVGSLGGVVGEVAPDTRSYAGPYFSAHVNFASSRNTSTAGVVSLPLLFHTPSLCQGESVALDFYSAAALGFGQEIGGSIGHVTFSNITDDELVSRTVRSAIMLGANTFWLLYNNQQLCDVFEAPSYGPVGWAECSAGTKYVNTSVVVGGCEVLVSPARWLGIGDFFNQSHEGYVARGGSWEEQFVPQQVEVLELGAKASSALQTAASGVNQATTQVGFELDRANDSSEWILVLIVALEAVFAVTALAVSSCFRVGVRWFKRNNRKPVVPGENILVTALVAFVKVASVAVLLGLGLTPVFIARAAERDADRMHHNDVYIYSSDRTTCFPAMWEGAPTESWCLTTRVADNSLLVRSYSKTFTSRYDALWSAAASIGGVALLLYAFLNCVNVATTPKEVSCVCKRTCCAQEVAVNDFRGEQHQPTHYRTSQVHTRAPQVHV